MLLVSSKLTFLNINFYFYPHNFKKINNMIFSLFFGVRDLYLSLKMIILLVRILYPGLFLKKI